MPYDDTAVRVQFKKKVQRNFVLLLCFVFLFVRLFVLHTVAAAATVAVCVCVNVVTQNANCRPIR